MKPRRAAKVDANQHVIVDALRQAGYSVVTGHDDLLVGAHGLTLWVEVKNPDGRDRLTKGQEVLLEGWKGAYLIARDAAEVLDWFSRRVRHG